MNHTVLVVGGCEQSPLSVGVGCEPALCQSGWLQATPVTPVLVRLPQAVPLLERDRKGGGEGRSTCPTFNEGRPRPCGS
jgi:hypothetical protein